jgi:flagellar secretion chaperone FliS
LTAYAPASPAAYQRQAILTAPPERLLVMLYDGACRFLLQAATCFREGAAPKGLERLNRAEAIIDELLVTLDLEAGGEIAQNLQGLYVFFKQQLAEARMEHEPAKVDWVRGQMSELRDAWAEVAAR